VDDRGERNRARSESTVRGSFRLLQLWLTLPKASRWTEPDHQIIRAADAPMRREPGVEVRLYSGTTGDLVSSTRNRVPVTLVDVRPEPGARVEQQLPASYNGFVYVIDGIAAVACCSTQASLEEPRSCRTVRSSETSRRTSSDRSSATAAARSATTRCREASV